MKKKILIFCCIVASARAQDIFLDIGPLQERETREKSCFWSLEYLHYLDNDYALSFTWLNEGHLDGFGAHHRDGQSVQLWVKKDTERNEFSLLTGMGPCLYSDTICNGKNENYRDSHGLGLECSVAGIWRIGPSWIFKAQGNYVDTFDNFDTFSFSTGIGYMLGPYPHKKNQECYLEEYQELTVFLGQTIVNSLDSEKGFAKSIEYRQGLIRGLEYSLAWLDEGRADLVDRRGVDAEIWLTSSFFNDSLTLDFGTGPYVFYDGKKTGGGSVGLAGLVSFSSSYRFSERFLARFSWSRIISDYNRDTDVILLGLGVKY
jgi:hypothetical protein